MWVKCGQTLSQYPTKQTKQSRFVLFNRMKPEQNGRHFADTIFKSIFLNENYHIFTQISLKFVPNGPIYDKPSLVQVKAWHPTGNKP